MNVAKIDPAAATRDPQNGATRSSLVLPIAVLALVIAVTRLPGAVGALSGVVINNDELIMTSTVLDRFLGVPPAFLSWPGGSLQLAGLPTALVYLFFKMHGHVSIGEFVQQLSNACRNPWPMVFLLRCLVAVVSSVGFAALLLPLAQWGVSRIVATTIILCFASLPEIWLHSQMAVPDGLSLGLGCLALVVFTVLPARASGFATSGALSGLALAAKLTILPLLPFQLGAGLHGRRGAAKGIALFGIGVALAFVFAAPYIWTDPMRFAKAVLGNLSREGNPMGPIKSTLRIFQLVTPALLLICIPGVYFLVKTRRWSAVIGAAVTVGMVVLLTARAGVVYNRYFLVASIPIAMVAAAGAELCFRRAEFWWPSRGRLFSIAVLLVAAGVLISVNTRAYAVALSAPQAGHRTLVALLQRLESLDPSYAVIVPRDGSLFAERLCGSASSQSLEALAGRVPHTPEAIAQFTSGVGLQQEAAYALAPTLNNQEQIVSAHFYIWAYPRNRRGVELFLYGLNDGERARFGLLSIPEAKSLAQTRRPSAFVIEANNSGARDLSGAERFGDYLLWINHE